MYIEKNQTLASLVEQYPEAVQLCHHYHLDYCCGGKNTLGEVCQLKNISFDNFKEEVCRCVANRHERIAIPEVGSTSEFINYIHDNHHEYIRNLFPVLLQNLDNLCQAHGEYHPELYQIQGIIQLEYMKLQHHLKTEEKKLFPYILDLYEASLYNEKVIQEEAIGIIPVLGKLEEEHQQDGAQLEALTRLCNDFVSPPYACTTWRNTYALLKIFKEDMMQHIHLENNILFPYAAELEGRTLA